MWTVFKAVFIQGRKPTS